MTAARHDVLDVERTVPAPPEQVWHAWTTAEGLATWWWASWPDTTHAVDLRVGGAYRIEAPTAGIAVRGEYLRIDALHRLEMTWIWSDDDGDGPEEHVVVTFTADGDTTVVAVRHTGPWTTPQPATDYLQGWEHVLDCLVDRLIDRHER